MYYCMCFSCFFFFKQKTAYEMRISDWSSDVCSSDLMIVGGDYVFVHAGVRPGVALKKQRPGDLRWIREEFLGESGGGSAPVIPGKIGRASCRERVCQYV